MNLEKQKERFKNHIATFTDYGNIKILDFKALNTSNYRIRFLFEEDYCRLHISGDLGELIASNYDNMTYEKFSDYVNNTSYFEEKIDCHNRAIYVYDEDKARAELMQRAIDDGDWLIESDRYSYEDDDEKNLITAFLKQYYNDAVDIPKEILIPEEIAEIELLQEWLWAEKKKKTKILLTKRGVKKDILTMAKENAEKYLLEQEQKLKDMKARSIGAVYDLQKYLNLPKPPMRMECFDISHIQGSETVASMVVFQDGKPDKNSYRRFKINSTEGKPDDFMSMREVTTRRYVGIDKNDLPDLIIIDGGKGQLSSALEIIRGAGHYSVPVVGLAKQFEYIFIEQSSEPVILPRHSDALYLVQSIRDEAHRFAITYHRKLRTKRNKISILDNISGIGAKRRKSLFDHFETIQNIKNASVDELMAVPGISEQIAKSIYNFFRTHELVSSKLK